MRQTPASLLTPVSLDAPPEAPPARQTPEGPPARQSPAPPARQTPGARPMLPQIVSPVSFPRDMEVRITPERHHFSPSPPANPSERKRNRPASFGNSTRSAKRSCGAGESVFGANGSGRGGRGL